VSEEHFDVVLLDLTLPDSSGLESFAALYAEAPEVPIVVLSGLTDEAMAIRAVQAGAQDYLVKGQVDDNLLVRSIRYAIERARRYRAEAALQSATEEFRAAKEIQQRLYPAVPPNVPGFDFAGALFPAKATAGDYFDYIPMLGGRLGIVVGDVSSHGMGPALLMSETRACLRTLAQATDDVCEILTRANRLLAADTDNFHFVTLMLARLDPLRRELVYGSAGQRCYVLHPGNRATVLDSTSLPLGVDAEAAIPTAPAVNLNAGDVLAFFTDGVSEAESADQGRFGIERTLDIIQTYRPEPAANILKRIRCAIDSFCDNQPLQDDVTMVVGKVL
jgi:serine phosphatase RsbU (regulator of sigma subunit)